MSRVSAQQRKTNRSQEAQTVAANGVAIGGGLQPKAGAVCQMDFQRCRWWSEVGQSLEVVQSPNGSPAGG